MKKYCQACNQATEYEDIPAKFCSHCSAPFAGTVASQIKTNIPPQISRPKPQIQEERNDLASRIRNRKREDEDEHQEIRERNIDLNAGISFEIPDLELEDGLNFERQKIKLETLAFDKGKKEKIIRPKIKIKDIASDFKNEITSGGRKNSKSIGGDGGE